MEIYDEPEPIRLFALLTYVFGTEQTLTTSTAVPPRLFDFFVHDLLIADCQMPMHFPDRSPRVHHLKNERDIHTNLFT